MDRKTGNTERYDWDRGTPNTSKSRVKESRYYQFHLRESGIFYYLRSFRSCKSRVKKRRKANEEPFSLNFCSFCGFFSGGI